jgi:hypothetical protein
MKRAALWLLPAFALTSIGSMTLATSRLKIDDSNNEGDPNGSNNIFRFAHDEEIDTYLTSIRSYMLTPPRNGRFGANRIPTFHGRPKGEVPGFEAIRNLAKKYQFASYVVGATPPDSNAAYKQYNEKHPNQPIEITKYRVTPVHMMWDGLRAAQSQTKNLNLQMSGAIDSAKGKADKDGYEVYSQEVKLEGCPAWIMVKSVTASDKSCYSCHTNIKEGAPIGHVMAILSQKSKP